MIKRLLICLILCGFMAVLVYADAKNFTTILNGGAIKTDNSTKVASFIGQPVVFATAESKDAIVSSAFASVITSVQSSSITFVNQTSTETFTTKYVPVKVLISTNSLTPTGMKISKVRYRISQGSSIKWEDEKEYEINTKAESILFEKSIDFDQMQNENYIQVYAQCTTDDEKSYFGAWSPSYTIKIDSGSLDTLEFTSPSSDVASLNPPITTKPFSLSSGTLTIGNYSINIDTATKIGSKVVYSTSTGILSLTYSDFAQIYKEQSSKEIPTKLTNNTEYTISLAVEGYESAQVTFKALDGAIADILTYPSPFNPKKEKINIRYILAKDSRVTIKLYDKAGKIVCKLIQSEPRSAGTNEEQWDGRNYAGDTLATGAYIVEIIAKETGSGKENRRYTALAIVGK